MMSESTQASLSTDLEESVAESEASREAHKDIVFTHERYGPVNLVVWWGKDHKEPIDLVTDLKSRAEACQVYKKSDFG